jgi:hypothetical protein
MATAASRSSRLPHAEIEALFPDAVKIVQQLRSMNSIASVSSENDLRYAFTISHIATSRDTSATGNAAKTVPPSPIAARTYRHAQRMRPDLPRAARRSARSG